MERINPLAFAFIRNDPLLPATIGSCVLRTHQEIRPRPHFFCGRLRFDPKLSAKVRKCVCDWGINASQKYCRMLQGEHSAILSTSIKQPFVIKIFVFYFLNGRIKQGLLYNSFIFCLILILHDYNKGLHFSLFNFNYTAPLKQNRLIYILWVK